MLNYSFQFVTNFLLQLRLLPRKLFEASNLFTATRHKVYLSVSSQFVVSYNAMLSKFSCLPGGQRNQRLGLHDYMFVLIMGRPYLYHVVRFLCPIY